MTKRDPNDLVTKSLENPIVRHEVEHEWFFDEIVIQLEAKMEELGLTRKDLAHRLGCSPANITRQLRQGSNLTIRSLMDLALALDQRFRAPVLEPLNASAPWEACYVETVSAGSHESWKRMTEAILAADPSVPASVSWVHRGTEAGTEGIPQLVPYMLHESGEINA